LSKENKEYSKHKRINKPKERTNDLSIIYQIKSKTISFNNNKHPERKKIDKHNE
jgi:hypothetical protein